MLFIVVYKIICMSFFIDYLIFYLQFIKICYLINIYSYCNMITFCEKKLFIFHDNLKIVWFYENDLIN